MKGRSMMVVGFVLPVSVSGILARERLLPPEESMVVSENVWNMLKTGGTYTILCHPQ
jgi:hypothetical protein